MKNMILLVALPFILGCTATAQTTPSKQPKTNRVETFSQLDSTEPAERPKWLQVVPESDEGFYFVGMSTKRTEKRNARNESFNDALIGFARYCGLNVQYLSEHRDTSIGGNGGLIDTFSKGNTVAKMQAEMLLGNVATKDRYTEKYSNFYGGSFMGHAFVDATLIYVPKTEMVLCKKNRKQANTFLTQKTNKIKQLEEKNKSLENQLVVEKQNTNVALAQAQQSSEFFKQVLNKPVIEKTEPIKKDLPKSNLKSITITQNNNSSCTNKICNGLVAYYPFNGDATDKSRNSHKHHGKVNGATLTADRLNNLNHAYSFDGINDYIDIPHNGQLEGMTSGLTLAVWLKTSSTQSQIVISKAGKTRTGSITDDVYHLGFNICCNKSFSSQINGAIQGVVIDKRQLTPASLYIAGSSKVITDGNWHHITFIWNKLNFKIYVDGQEDSNLVYYNNKSTNSKSLNSSIATTLRIGGGMDPFSGSIDEVRIYNRALSANEVKELYSFIL